MFHVVKAVEGDAESEEKRYEISAQNMPLSRESIVQKSIFFLLIADIKTKFSAQYEFSNFHPTTIHQSQLRE
jgi:hypothetical protein